MDSTGKNNDSGSGSLKIHSCTVGPESKIRIDGPTIMLTGAYCPNGHNLLAEDGPLFAGFPGIRVKVREERNGTEAEVTLSPIHGDHSKCTTASLPAGARCQVTCPICGVDLPRITKCDCPEGGEFLVLYLTQRLEKGSYVAFCNIWGCPRSQIVEEFTLISEFIDMMDDEEGKEAAPGSANTQP